MATAAHFPAALQPTAAEAVSQAFMAGVHRGSVVAAGAAAAAALVAVFLVPSRAAAPAEPLSGTSPASSRTRQETPSRV